MFGRCSGNWTKKWNSSARGKRTFSLILKPCFSTKLRRIMKRKKKTYRQTDRQTKITLTVTETGAQGVVKKTNIHKKLSANVASNPTPLNSTLFQSSQYLCWVMGGGVRSVKQLHSVKKLWFLSVSLMSLLSVLKCHKKEVSSSPLKTKALSVSNAHYPVGLSGLGFSFC